MAALALAVEGETNNDPSSILLTACHGEIFSKSTVAHVKVGHMNITTPLLRVICHPFGKTWYNLPIYKI